MKHLEKVLSDIGYKPITGNTLPIDKIYEFAEEISHFEDVKKFHKKFEMPTPDQPTKISPELMRRGIWALIEELQKFSESCGFCISYKLKSRKSHHGSAAEQAAGLVDIVYSAMGIAVRLGLPWQELWDDAHEVNMRKNSAHDCSNGGKVSEILDTFTYDPTGELSNVSTEDLANELSKRGGHPGALADALLLALKKSQDYNQGASTDPHDIDRSEYFPFGSLSFAQMLHTKALRFSSLVRVEMGGNEPNYEGLMDTALDIMNYAAFYVDSKRRGDV